MEVENGAQVGCPYQRMRAQGSHVIIPVQTSLPVKGGSWAEATTAPHDDYTHESLIYNLIYNITQ